MINLVDDAVKMFLSIIAVYFITLMAVFLLRENFSFISYIAGVISAYLINKYKM